MRRWRNDVCYANDVAVGNDVCYASDVCRWHNERKGNLKYEI